MFYSTDPPWCPFKINWPFLTTSRAVEAELAKEQEIKHRALAELEEKKALISDLEEKEAKWREEALRRQQEVRVGPGIQSQSFAFI